MNSDLKFIYTLKLCYIITKFAKESFKVWFRIPCCKTLRLTLLAIFIDFLKTTTDKI